MGNKNVLALNYSAGYVSGGSDGKNLPVMGETWVQSLDQEDSLEKGTATHTSILAWRIPWTEEPGGLQFIRLQRVGHNGMTNSFSFTWMHVFRGKNGEEPRWRRSRTGRTLSPPQIHQKSI